MKKLLPLMIFCSHCVAMHGYESQGAVESRDAPCSQLEAQERNDNFDRFKDEHKLSEGD